MTPDGLKILADLRRHAAAFDLGADKLGESLCAAFTDGVQASIAAGEAPDGTRWDDLSDAYAARKAVTHPGKPIGVAEGVMSDPAEVAGDVIVLGADAAMVTYGMTEEAREEAAAFQQGDPARNRPARPFWGWTPASEQAVAALLAARLKKIVG